MWETIVSGETWRGEICNRSKDGSLYWVDATNFSWLDSEGQIACYVSFRMDITNRKEAESQRDRLLSESVELAQIIRDSPEEVYIFSQEDWHFVEVNQGGCESTGYTGDELKQMTPVHIKPEFSEDQFAEWLKPLYADEVDKLELQTVHERKNESNYPVRISLHKSVYQGEPVFVAFAHDLTTVQELEHRLARAQKLEALGELSAGVAHEINTPMQFVGGNIEFLHKSSEKLFSVVNKCRELIGDTEPISWEKRREEFEKIAKESRFDWICEQFPIAISECRDGVERTVKILKAMKDFSHPGEKEFSPIDINEGY